MISKKQKQSILDSIQNPCLMASEVEIKCAMDLLELLEPCIKVNPDNRVNLGMGHADKTFLGLYRTLKSRIFSDEKKEKKLIEALKKIEHVSLNKSGISVLEIIHELKYEGLL